MVLPMVDYPACLIWVNSDSVVLEVEDHIEGAKEAKAEGHDGSCFVVLVAHYVENTDLLVSSGDYLYVGFWLQQVLVAVELEGNMGELSDRVAVASRTGLELAANLDSGNEGPPLVKVLLGEQDLIQCWEGDFLSILLLLDDIAKVHLK